MDHDHNQSYTDSFSSKEFHGCNLKLLSRESTIASQVGLTMHSNLSVFPGKKVQTVIDPSNYSDGQLFMMLHMETLLS